MINQAPNIVENILINKIQKYLDEINKKRKQAIKDNKNVEYIHKFRTNLRRLFSIIDEFQTIIKNSNSIKIKIKKIFSYTKKLRDLDVMKNYIIEYQNSQNLHEDESVQELLKKIEKKRKFYYKKFIKFIESSKYKKIYSFIREESIQYEMALGSYTETILYLLISKFYKIFSNPHFYEETISFDHLHKLRIEIKKTRYIFELFEEQFKFKAIDSTISKLSFLQEKSGNILDYNVIIQYLSQYNEYEKIINYHLTKMDEQLNGWKKEIQNFYREKDSYIEQLKNEFLTN